jgi:hypothetical protein
MFKHKIYKRSRPAFLMRFRLLRLHEEVQKAVDTRRATEDPAGVLEQYVEESEGSAPNLCFAQIGYAVDIVLCASAVETL